MQHRGKLVSARSGQVSIASAPVLYGLAVYTVLAVHYDTKSGRYVIFRLQDHVARLNNSAKIVGLRLEREIEVEQFKNELRQLLIANEVTEDVLVRATLFTDEEMAGTKSHGLPTSFSMYVYGGAPLYDPAGVHVGVSAWRRTPDVCIPSRAKINGSYMNATLMKNQALADGYDDAIALNTCGHVAESTVANIFLVRNGTLITPDLTSDILEGITRDSILRMAKAYGIEVCERAIDKSELYIADEIFLTGTSAHVTPVLSVDRRPVGGGVSGPITTLLQAQYRQARSGIKVIESNWITRL